MEVNICIDLGKTNFRIGTVSLDHKILNSKILATKDILYAVDGVNNMAKVITEYIEEYIVSETINCIMMGVPFPVSKDKETIYSANELFLTDSVNLRKELENLLGLPVYMDNDINVLASYDLVEKNLLKSDCVVAFYVGTGFGGVIYINGKFHAGKNGFAGEVGHIPIHNDFTECVCGKKGCAEMIASGKYLKELQKNNFPNTNIEDIFVKHLDDKKIQQFVYTLAIVIATSVVILDPDHVILGGGVVTMKNFPKKLLENHIKENILKPSNNISVIYSDACNDTSILGASSYAELFLPN